jgi:zinc protease
MRLDVRQWCRQSLRGFALAVLFALVSCSRPAAVQPQVQFRMRDFHLRSGLRVIVEEDHSAPVVGVVSVVGAGSTSDPPGKEGLAHLVEHLTFRAKPSADRAAWDLFDQAGAADLNAMTGFDATTYYEFGARDVLVDLLTLEGLRLIDPLARLDPKTFDRERDVVRNELREKGETRLIGAVWAALLKATFPGAHPYARPPVGTHESLSALTLDDARAFVKQHYRPSNVTLLVIGDVKLETFEKVLGEALPSVLSEPTADKIVTGSRLPARAPEPPAPPPATAMASLEGPVAAPELYLAWSAPPSYGEASHMIQLAVGSVSAVVADAEEHDSDIVGGTAFAMHGTLASTVVCRVLLREGAHPEKSAERVMDELYRNWMTSREAPLAADVRFEQRRAGLATFAMSQGEDLETRGVDRAEFAHFSGDPAVYNRQFSALDAVDRTKLADFHSRYINRERARIVYVKPLPASLAAPPARTGISGFTEESAGFSYDVASIPRLAVPAGFAQNFRLERLENGLVIEATRRGKLPIVTVGIGFRGGAADETKQGAAALAWLSAYVQRVSYGHFRDHGAYLRRRRTDNDDGVVFEVRAPASALGRVLKILADHVRSLRVHRPLDDFDRYRLPYVRRAQALPEAAADRAFRRALFEGHPYAHTGEIPEDARPDESAANAWLETVLNPARGVLAIAGNVDPAEALALARDAFEGWGSAASPSEPPSLPEAGKGATIVTHRPGATQAQIRVGCRLPASSDATAVGNQVLAQTLSGQLRALRTDMGVTYGVHVSTATLPGGTAVLYLDSAVENGGLTGALRTIHSTLVGAARLTQTDFDRGRWAVARRYNLDLVTPDDWVSRALAIGRRGWPLSSVDAVPKNLATVDRTRLVASLRRCAAEGVVSVVGDETIARKSLAEAWR